MCSWCMKKKKKRKKKKQLFMIINGVKVGWFREGEAPVAITSTSILVLQGRGEISEDLRT